MIIIIIIKVIIIIIIIINLMYLQFLIIDVPLSLIKSFLVLTNVWGTLRSSVYLQQEGLLQYVKVRPNYLS